MKRILIKTALSAGVFMVVFMVAVTVSYVLPKTEISEMVTTIIAFGGGFIGGEIVIGIWRC